MPSIPLLRRVAAADDAIDKRVLDSRQLRDATAHIARSVSEHARRLSSQVSRLLRRRAPNCPSGVIEDCYAGLNAGPSPGAVVGIVLGSVAAFLLLLWILWILSQGTDFIRTTAIEEEEIVVRRPARSRRSGHRRREEVRERSPRRERIIRQERIVRDRVDSMPPPRDSSRFRETIIVDDRPERRVEGDDIVEVFEEHSTFSEDMPPRRGSRRSSAIR